MAATQPANAPGTPATPSTPAEPVAPAGDRLAALRRDGVMVVVDVGGPHLPRIVYWGRDLGTLSQDEMAALPMAALVGYGPRQTDPDVPFTLLPSRAQGWQGWPGLTGHRGGLASQPLFTLDEVSVAGGGPADDGAGGASVRFRGSDAAAQLAVEGELELTVDGVLKHRITLANTAPDGTAPYDVVDLLALLPVPEDTAELLDFAGRWADEAQPQRHSIAQGTWLREQRRGRTGPDTPLVLFAGTKGFGYRSGEVWGIHLGWSGDQRYLAQRLNTGTTLIGVGEILAAGEVSLAPGESVTTPWAYAVYSGRGVDGASARLHAMLRRRPGHPGEDRPVLLNIWEAVGFDMDFQRLAQLADAAAEIGVERFVVDDGWFGARRDDTKGLGDWYVSPDVWPDGLGPIADYVRSRGMQFGLWFEPEMVNEDSELMRAHPGWALGTAGRLPPRWRNQQVLDVSHPEAYEYLLERMSSLVEQAGIGYIKWDHNRDLADPVHRSGPRAGRPAVRDQTLAAYRLMEELRRRHPGLEIESCSSGGSRVDLGVIAHTDRVWASDCIDPIERSRIVPGFATLLPLELIGSHVASGRSQTTGRQHDLSLRLAVALFGHQGIEWDLTEATAEERRGLATWASLAKSFRHLLYRGELVRAERPTDPGSVLFGVVAQDRSEALFLFLRSATIPQTETPPLELDGLDPARRYLVRWVDLRGGEGPFPEDQRARPTTHGAVVPGSLIMSAGILAPSLPPEQAAVVHLTAQ